ILFSGAIGGESKIIFNRDPRTRVEKVAPWLTTDDNPYPAVVDGRIIWIVDAYTTLDAYPYSTPNSLQEATTDDTGRVMPRNEIAYARNSV
ncbi:UPF0182 family protein, partial [Rhodococcus fascians]|uniref:UPF0182 family protein n=1 Tax=Rhodococcoides fascians TaxID=1828 RepID=UPI0024B8F5CD